MNLRKDCPLRLSIRCSSSLVPSVVVTRPWVSPRVNRAEPWARASKPTSQEMARTCAVPRSPMRFPSCVIIRRMYSYLRSSNACLTSLSLPKKGWPSAHSCATRSFLIFEHERYGQLSKIKKDLVAQLCAEGQPFFGKDKDVKQALEDLKYEYMRRMITHEGKRIGDRGTAQVRAISCEVGLLARAHGSALFTRGETQGLVTTTLGTSDDEQRMESLKGQSFRKFMLHYNFPPYSVGEVKPLRGAGRREIGHGMLAERALRAMLPADDKFPYTIRVVSDILESNGSSSMATVCGGALSLMDAGVPISAPVAGIAMGLIKEDGKIAILSDILGDEDHLGDMDFKVCGTAKGITSIQMDIKITGVDKQI